jgi:hypothetical protein
MPGLRLGPLVGAEGRDDQLQEESRARLEPPQQSRHGQAAPRPLRRGLAAVSPSDSGIGHGAARATAHNRAVAMPPACAREGGLHRLAETFAEQGAGMQRAFGASVAVRRCPQPQARQMGPRAAGGVAAQHRHQA